VSEEALKLAREWLDLNERQHAYPEAFDNCITLGDEAPVATLARAVIAQHDELTRLRAELRLANSIINQTPSMAMIASLRAALTEACEIALNIELHPDQDAMCSRIVELRKLVTP
jgi:hypothetical protein